MSDPQSPDRWPPPADASEGRFGAADWDHDPPGLAAGDDPWRRFYESPSPRRRRPPWLVAGIVTAVVVGVMAVWLLVPSPEPAVPSSAAPPSASPQPLAPPNADMARLVGLLPAGYPADACHPAAPAGGGLAAMRCAGNTDPGGPSSATYTLVGDTAALASAFNDVVHGLPVVTCPGNIQSPGPWRRNATPQKASGALVCAVQRGGESTLAWTDDARRLLSVVHADGSALGRLYTWWSSHS